MPYDCVRRASIVPLDQVVERTIQTELSFQSLEDNTVQSANVKLCAKKVLAKLSW